MKEKILELFRQGLSYRQIAKQLNCSKGTIAFHCGKGQKQKYYQNRQRIRSEFRKQLKLEHGGKCQKCGYDKCLAALHFHHLDPSTKEGKVSDMFYTKNKKAAQEEAKKCQLICANCHAELHDNEEA